MQTKSQIQSDLFIEKASGKKESKKEKSPANNLENLNACCCL
jgi:hypothetical protein